MHHDIHTMHGASQAVAVAHIPNEITDIRVIQATQAHFQLFELISAKDDQLGGMEFLHHDLDKLLAKGTGATGN